MAAMVSSGSSRPTQTCATAPGMAEQPQPGMQQRGLSLPQFSLPNLMVTSSQVVLDTTQGVLSDPTRVGQGALQGARIQMAQQLLPGAMPSSQVQAGSGHRRDRQGFNEAHWDSYPNDMEGCTRRSHYMDNQIRRLTEKNASFGGGAVTLQTGINFARFINRFSELKGWDNEMAAQIFRGLIQ